uniref:RING-type E3 ubiquitin transferase n=1 Tax=Araucaria cunninghamii TaxID=56994 RepID=A0A0D6R1N0_ARACU
MGQNLSCRVTHEALFSAVEEGDLRMVGAMLEKEPNLIRHSTVYQKLSPLHIAAAHGKIEVLSMLLEKGMHPDVLDRYKQTPLMMAAISGNVSCIEKLLQAGANVLLFDSLHGRTGLHYAANNGHTDCLGAILSAGHSTPVAESWGFARYVNVRDASGATPLHLAARNGHSRAVHLLLDNGALVCASTGAHGRPGSTPLHFAARGGCLESVRELLAWGADRIQRDSSGRIPYAVALKYKHRTCAALLNPGSAEPLVWPSPWKFISELNQETKMLLEKALMEANRAREKNILFGAAPSSSSTDQEDNTDDGLSDESESEVCCICFDQLCTIEVQDCGHRMCALCTLALCCHNKPNPTLALSAPPVCPFCRSSIAQLVVVPAKEINMETDTSKTAKPRKSKSLSEGSSSFKALQAKGSFGKLSGKGSETFADSSDWMDKP